ncbi:MAG: efflux RND transporter periplasmic adaptor subunit, partial [Ktedonobacterales bacterium]
MADDDVDSLDSEPTVEDLPDKPRLFRWGRLGTVRPPRRPVWERAPRGRAFLSFRRVRILAIGLAVLFLVALVALVIQSRFPVVQYTQAKVGTLTVQFDTTGTLQSASYAANFAGSGRIAEINVTVGQQVSAGDPLAKLDTTQLQDAVNQANAAVTSAQTKVTDAQDNLAKVQAATSAQVQAAYDAEQNAINGCKSGDSGCAQAAQDAYAAAQAQADQQNAAAQLTVDDAQSALSSAQALLQTAQDNLNGATLTAPHAGTIAAITQAVGSTVVGSNATAPVTNFIVIADLNTLQIQANVPVTKVTGVQNGTLVRFTVPSAGAAHFTGQVEGVSPTGKLVNHVLTYPLTINVDMQSVQNGSAHLYPGMTADVNVVVVEKPGVTLIPVSAVTFAQAAGNTKDGGF